MKKKGLFNAATEPRPDFFPCQYLVKDPALVAANPLVLKTLIVAAEVQTYVKTPASLFHSLS
jgi:hypothetical protein